MLMATPPSDAVLIAFIGLTGAVVLTVVYATGVRLPRFTGWRLALVFGGISLVTVPVPLLIYYAPAGGWAVVAIAVALYVIAVLVLGFGTPNSPDDEPPDKGTP